MTNPISVVIEALSVATTASGLGESTFELVSGIKNAPEHILRLRNTLHRLYPILGNLQSILEEESQKKEALEVEGRLPSHLLENTTELVESCIDALQDVRKVVSRFVQSDGQALKGTWRLLRWELLRKNDTLILQKALADRCAALGLACDSLIIFNSNQTTAGMRQLHQELRELKNEITTSKNLEPGSHAVLSTINFGDDPLNISSYNLPMQRFLARTESIISSESRMNYLRSDVSVETTAMPEDQGVPPVGEIPEPHGAERLEISGQPISWELSTDKPNPAMVMPSSDELTLSTQPTQSLDMNRLQVVVWDAHVLINEQELFQKMVERDDYMIVMPRNVVKFIMRAAVEGKAEAQNAVWNLRQAIEQKRNVRVLTSSGDDVTTSNLFSFLSDDDNRSLHTEDSAKVVLEISRRASDLSNRINRRLDEEANPVIVLTENRSLEQRAAATGIAALSVGKVRQLLEALVSRRRNTQARTNLNSSGPDDQSVASIAFEPPPGPSDPNPEPPSENDKHIESMNDKRYFSGPEPSSSSKTPGQLPSPAKPNKKGDKPSLRMKIGRLFTSHKSQQKVPG